jgi:hypothetical protein
MHEIVDVRRAAGGRGVLPAGTHPTHRAARAQLIRLYYAVHIRYPFPRATRSDLPWMFKPACHFLYRVKMCYSARLTTISFYCKYIIQK